MGREVRKVPGNWHHPKDENGGYIPLLGFETFEQALADWIEGDAKWSEGLRKSLNDDTPWVSNEDERAESYSYVEYAGEKPEQHDYMPTWEESELTHI